MAAARQNGIPIRGNTVGTSGQANTVRDGGTAWEAMAVQSRQWPSWRNRSMRNLSTLCPMPGVVDSRLPATFRMRMEFSPIQVAACEGSVIWSGNTSIVGRARRRQASRVVLAPAEAVAMHWSVHASIYGGRDRGK